MLPYVSEAKNLNFESPSTSILCVFDKYRPLVHWFIWFLSDIFSSVTMDLNKDNFIPKSGEWLFGV